MSRHQIIDTHVHFWNMRDPEPGLRWSWLERDVDHAVLGNIDAIKMLKYDIGSLWAEARFADVAGFVHVQAAIDSDDPVRETQWLTRMREDSPVPFTIVAHVDLGSPVSVAQLEGHLASPYVVGVRDLATEVLLASGEIDQAFEASLSWMTDHALVLDVDCEWPNMAALAELARRHPRLPIVLEHVGFPRRRDDSYFSSWSANLAALSALPNVTCKISGLGMTDPGFTADSLRRWVSASLDAFGPSRCLLGSNWPLDRLFSSYDVIMDVYRGFLKGFSEDEQILVLSANAARIYGL